MRIAICDDVVNDIETIVECIKNNRDYSTSFNIEIFNSAEELVNMYRNGYFADIIFMDIEMDEMTGIDAAKLIRNKDKNVIIIFISNHSERVFETFDCETFNFIVKPFTQEKFNDTFEKAIEKYKLNNAYFIVTWKNENTRILVKNIKYVECYRKHMIFYTFDGIYEMCITLSETLKKLSPFGFIQTHQGYIVNMNHIKKFDNYDIILTDDTKVMISARKKAEVLFKYSEFVERWK